jgi:cell division protein FtsN
MGNILPACSRPECRRSRSSGTKKENQVKPKTSLVVGAFSLVLFIAGCTASQTPGPAGPQGAAGATGATGDAGRDSDERRAEEQRRADAQRGADAQRVADAQKAADEQRRLDEQRGADQQRRVDEQKQADKKAREDRNASCPSGQHLYTSADTGKTSCVRD